MFLDPIEFVMTGYDELLSTQGRISQVFNEKSFKSTKGISHTSVIVPHHHPCVHHSLIVYSVNMVNKIFGLSFVEQVSMLRAFGCIHHAPFYFLKTCQKNREIANNRGCMLGYSVAEYAINLWHGDKHNWLSRYNSYEQNGPSLPTCSTFLSDVLWFVKVSLFSARWYTIWPNSKQWRKKIYKQMLKTLSTKVQNVGSLAANQQK